MKYYVYFDAYGHARRAISEKQLKDEYQNEVDRFLEAMCRRGPDTDEGHISGHVGILSFQNKKDLTDYLESLGDEIDGFYRADADSRPYNF